MENIYDKSWDNIPEKYNEKSFQYFGNPNLQHNPWSSGSRWIDTLNTAGDIANSIWGNNQPQFYAPQINWKGNGLADVKGQSFENKGYVDPMVRRYLNNQIARAGMYGYGDNNSMTNRLRSMFGGSKLGDITDNSPVYNTINYGTTNYPYTDYLNTSTADYLNNIYSADYMPDKISGNWAGY